MAEFKTKQTGTLVSGSLTSAAIPHNGGQVRVLLQGDFDGGTAVVQYCDTESGTYGTATDIITGNTLSVAAGTDNVPYAGILDIAAGFLKISISGGAGTPVLRWTTTHDQSAFKV